MTTVLDNKDTDDLEIIEDPVLTTKDNPFNPKTHYKNWKTWDESNGYYTEALVARVANIPPDADTEDELLMEEYVDKAHRIILDNDMLGVYLLV